MDKVVNFELMAHPANWVVVTLMFLLASFGIRFVMQAAQVSSDTATA
jgi:hypothetical protein